MNIYCVYLTTYSGNKLPPFYIGSSSIERINKGYKGTVKSKQYKKIWNRELKYNSHLFKTKIISIQNSREEATAKEKYLQTKMNVVKSSLYINMSIATEKGFFGMDVSGKNNPNFGKKPQTFDKSNYRKPKSEEHKKNLKKPKSDEHKRKLSISKIGKLLSIETKEKMSIAHAKTYIAISPNNEILLLTNLTKFCKEKGLVPQNASQVASGARPHHKKWKFLYYDESVFRKLKETI